MTKRTRFEVEEWKLCAVHGLGRRRAPCIGAFRPACGSRRIFSPPARTLASAARVKGGGRSMIAPQPLHLQQWNGRVAGRHRRRVPKGPSQVSDYRRPIAPFDSALPNHYSSAITAQVKSISLITQGLPLAPSGTPAPPPGTRPAHPAALNDPSFPPESGARPESPSACAPRSLARGYR